MCKSCLVDSIIANGEDYYWCPFCNDKSSNVSILQFSHELAGKRELAYFIHDLILKEIKEANLDTESNEYTNLVKSIKYI